MTAHANTIIEVPEVRRRSTGLFVSLPPTVPAERAEGGSWTAVGARWEADVCDPADSWNDEVCPEDTPDLRTAPVPPYNEVFTEFNLTLTAGIKCKAVGDLGHERYQPAALYEAAVRRIANSAQYVIEKALSTGRAWRRVLDGNDEWTGAFEVAHVLLHPITGAPVLPFALDTPEEPVVTAVPPSAWVSNMENLMGDLSTEQLALYVPAIAAAHMVGGNGPVFREGNTFRTALGTPVVFGWGFHGVDPKDGTTAATAGEAWGVMAPEAKIFRSGRLDPLSGDYQAALDRVHNSGEYWVEEDFSVGFGPCRGAIGQISLEKE